MDTSSILLKDSLLLIWNNRNAAERLAIMEKIYAPDITFFEDDNAQPFIGFEPINNLIEKLQQSWPADFEFILTEAPKSNHNIQHISWHLGITGQEPAATGMDVAIIEGGKIKSLYLLLNNK
jgi:ketosteroid isomerase-like protein